jgi:Flp pilus assembly protein TadG
MVQLVDKLRKVRVIMRDESGGTLAEMALTVPLLIILLAGVAEIGRYFQNYTTMVKSTRAAARYLSNHKYNNLEVSRAKNLAVCGQLTSCSEAQRLVKGAAPENICIRTTLVPASTQIETVTVSIPRDPTMTCDGDTTAVKLVYQPIFDVAGLLGLIGNDTFSLSYPIAPSTTMRYIPGD